MQPRSKRDGKFSLSCRQISKQHHQTMLLAELWLHASYASYILELCTPINLSELQSNCLKCPRHVRESDVTYHSSIQTIAGFAFQRAYTSLGQALYQHHIDGRSCLHQARYYPARAHIMPWASIRWPPTNSLSVYVELLKSDGYFWLKSGFWIKQWFPYLVFRISKQGISTNRTFSQAQIVKQRNITQNQITSTTVLFEGFLPFAIKYEWNCNTPLDEVYGVYGSAEDVL